MDIAILREQGLWTELVECHRGPIHVIFRGRKTVDGPRLIIKSLRTDFPDEQAVAALRHEFAILERLQLTGIVEPIALKKLRGLPVLILHDAGTQSVADLVAETDGKGLALEDFFHIVLPLTAILQDLHSAQIVHRNLSPSNIVLDDELSPTLIDFVRALPFSQIVSEMLPTQTLNGSLQYIAPEQSGRTGRPVDHRSDLYVLGLTLYEMLVGTTPFEGQDSLELLHAHLTGRPTPPHELRTELPPILSHIVMKLLAKEPSQRYQSARALRSDLALVQAAMTEGRTLSVHELSEDPPRGLQWTRLHGRTHVFEQLISALDQVAMGQHCTVLISGTAGIGKTALARELYRPVAERHGFFASGRYEAHALHRPFHGIYEALHWLTQNALTWSADRLELWLSGLKAALGSAAPVLAEITPDFGNLLKDLPPAPQVGSLESRSRLHFAVRALLASFTGPGNPLVVFLDDVHLMDAASSALIEYLVMEADVSNLMLVLAFRDDTETSEVSTRTLSRITSAGTHLLHIRPALLSLAQVTEMLAEVLDCTLDEVQQLGQRLFQHSQGNPLFLRQLLAYLVQTGMLTQLGSGVWEWDIRKIDQLELRDNVVDLLLRELEQLPRHTLEILTVAAGFGERFGLELLARTLEKPALEVADALWPAVSRGLLHPLKASYQVLRHSESEGDELKGLKAVMRFTHSRVVQAVWGRLAPVVQEQIQHSIGRILLDSWRSHGETEHFFAALYHLERSRHLITNLQEKQELAELYLKGARLAREAGTFQSALAFAQSGIELLGYGQWYDAPEISLNLHREAAHCAWHEGEHSRTSALVTTALKHFPSGLKMLEFQVLQLQVLCSSGQFVEAVAAGRLSLADLGLELPFERLEEANEELEARILAQLRLDALNILEDRILQDERLEAIVRLLSVLSEAGYFSNQPLTNYCVLQIANICFEHGRTRDAIHPLAYLGLLLGQSFGDFALGHRVGRAAVLLAQRSGDAVQRCRSLHIFGSHLNHWQAPLQEGAQVLRDAISSGLEGGEVQFVAYAGSGLVMNLLCQGEPLVEVSRDLDTALAFATKHAHRPMMLLHQVCQLFVRWLQSQATEFPSEIARAEAELLEERMGDDRTLQCLSLHWRLRASVMMEDWSHASTLIDRLEVLQPYISGLAIQAEFPLFAGICLARQAESWGEDGRKPLLLELDRHLNQLLQFAEGCPHNFAAKARILLAERALLRGNVLEAADIFEQAAENARSAGFLVDEALAHELAGRMWWRKGRRLAARGHLEAAARGYGLWGASRKVTQLVQQYPELELPGRVVFANQSLEHPPSQSTEPTSFDLSTLMKASSSIVGELELNRLMERLLQVTIETAGAEFAALVLIEQDRLMVRATLEHSLNQFHLHNTPLEQSDLVSATMINYSRRTGRPLVVGAAEASGLFRDDPYIQRCKPRSVLCLPMMHRARMVGMLYLENNLIPHAFNTRRLELLGLLSTQLAVALENGRLYLGLQREIGERMRAEQALRELNAALEQRVVERTRTLERLNAELEQFAYITSHDLQEPLRTITAFLGLLEEDYASQLPDDGKYYVRAAVEGAVRMRELIRDLLAYSRVGGSNITPTPTDLNDVIRQVRMNLTRALHENDGVLEASNLPTVMANTREMVQLFQNLCSNALKFRSDKRPHILIEAKRVEDFWEIRVKDNGIGIDPNHHQKIFQVFQRLHIREQYPGNGIGLAIVRKVVERFGGSVQVESEPGQGSTFILSLPAVETLEGFVPKAGRD